jgi:hypothetical protein
MKKPVKETGLAAFAPAKPAPAPLAAAIPGRSRGKGDVVALTLRLNRSDWERVHQLALSEGTSIQQLVLSGLSMVFATKGLPGVTSVAGTSSTVTP